jgi:hypothetical protein
MNIELYHTSPLKIEQVTDKGLFGSFLFFADEPYQMSRGTVYTYKIEIDEGDIINASSLFYEDADGVLIPLVERAANEFGISKEIAEQLIEESASIYDVDTDIDAADLADASWRTQFYSAKAAAMLGYRGVRVRDEQGYSVMIDMKDHEIDMILL